MNGAPGSACAPRAGGSHHDGRAAGLLLGSALDEGIFPPDFFHLTITSPPYNVGIAYDGGDGDSAEWADYLAFSRRWLANVLRWSAPGGRLCLNVLMDDLSAPRRPMSAEIVNAALSVGWKFHASIVWNQNHGGGTAWGSFASASAPCVQNRSEVVLVFYKGEWARGKGESDITRAEFVDWIGGNWSFPSESAKRIGHPAPFPLELPQRCIRLFSFVGDRILDPFAGSGTTLVAAADLGREAHGIEKSPEYHNLANTRLRNATGRLLG